MKKSLLVLLLAILLPSLVLGWLALRSVREQQIVLERRTAELYQNQTDTVATSTRSLISDVRRGFAEKLHQMLTGANPQRLAGEFTARLREQWPQPAIGFALAADGRLLSPTMGEAAGNAQIRQFLSDNGSFVAGKSTVTAYPVPMSELNRPEMQQRMAQRGNAKSQGPALSPSPSPSTFDSRAKIAPAPAASAAASAAPNKDSADFSTTRNVAPQQVLSSPDSQLTWATADFRAFTAEGNEGVVNRFVKDQLQMIFWVRPAEAPALVFGCLVRTADLSAQWPGVLETVSPAPDRSGADPDYLVALLDDKAQPAAVAPAESKVPDWKKPFVATEIGEALPHWEAALYLRHPERLEAAARLARRNLFFLIACALGAIAIGGWVVVAETRRQLLLAEKKTDFVSNVSHELKTPLTSIRMFAELLHTGRAAPERRPEYLRIMMVEAERLTRLINNVLDFARIERHERRVEKRSFDLGEMLAGIWSLHAPHLRETGFTAEWQNEAPSVLVQGDPDALAQVVLNLLSNAEKYGGERKEITMRSYREGAEICLSVLDRGPGVPRGEEAKIFEPFYRAHDSLSSGIPGTGLGLSLARHQAREHGGDLIYRSRPGGGSDFTLRLPLPSPAAS